MPTVTVKLKVLIPDVPTHVLTDKGVKMPLSALTKEAAEKVAEAWKESLLEKRLEQVSDHDARIIKAFREDEKRSGSVIGCLRDALASPIGLREALAKDLQ